MFMSHHLSMDTKSLWNNKEVSQSQFSRYDKGFHINWWNGLYFYISDYNANVSVHCLLFSFSNTYMSLCPIHLILRLISVCYIPSEFVTSISVDQCGNGRYSHPNDLTKWMDTWTHQAYAECSFITIQILTCFDANVRDQHFLIHHITSLISTLEKTRVSFLAQFWQSVCLILWSIHFSTFN